MILLQELCDRLKILQNDSILNDELALHGLRLQCNTFEYTVIAVTIEALDVLEHLLPLVDEHSDGATPV